MKRQQIDDLVLKMILVDCGLILLMQMLSFSTAVSFFFHLIFPLVGIYWLINFPKKFDRVDGLILLTILLACFVTGWDFIVLKKALKFAYFKKLLFFVFALLFLDICHHKKLNHAQTLLIYKFSQIQSMMFVVMFFLQRTDRYLIDQKVSRYLTMNFSNPNLLALFLAVFIMIEASGFFMKQTEKQLRFRGFRVLSLLYLLLETQARNSQLVIVVFGVLFAWVYFSRKKSFSIPSWCLLVVSYFPILFSALYMVLVESAFVQSAFGFLAGIGKKLNSRVDMWSDAWSIVMNSPWKGSYFTLSHSYGFSQMHNTLLDTAASYGVIVMVLLGIVFFALTLKKHGLKDKRRFICLIGFGCTLLLGMAETAMLIGSLGIFVLMGLPLLLANAEMMESDLDYQGEEFHLFKKRILSSKWVCEIKNEIGKFKVKK